jgi:membrane protein
MIIILLWVYYSSAILYFGAAFTRAYALHKGSNIYPNNYAVWIKEVELENKASIHAIKNKTITSTTVIAPKEDSEEEVVE